MSTGVLTKTSGWKLVRIALALGVLLAAAAILSLFVPYRGFQGETFVRLERGTSAVATGRALAQAGVIRYAWQFWMERALRPKAKLQAGEYRFDQSATVRNVFDKLARGDVYYVEFTVPEGSNMFDIAKALEAAGVMSAEDFLRAASDAAPIRDLAPHAETLEGYLFPATYRLSHGVAAADLCRQMTGQFRRHWKKLAAADRADAHSGDGQAADVNATITLASLVEKETGIAGERPLVAGVFANRLKKGMRLECDPTTIYAALLEDRYRDGIHRSDLASQNPYNTYQHAGLPPGPIANPGEASIAAALEPAETNYLYFVARPEGGGHQFSATLAEHHKATQEYRHGRGNTTKKTGKAG
jgi:UPF0755 protein